MAKLTIQRDEGWADRHRKYYVYLNNANVGFIKRGEQLTIDVETGSFELYAGVDWAKTNMVFFTIEDPTEQRTFAICSRLRGARVFLSLFLSIASIFIKGVWIRLEEI